MDFSAKVALVVGLFSLSFMLNLPMGYVRSLTRKFSFAWFLCIHAPIPIIVLGRLFSGLSYKYIPVFLVAAFLGQVWGGKVEF